MSRLVKLVNAKTPWITDAGLETSIIYHEGLDLPHFAAFTLLDTKVGRDALTRYFENYARLARQAGTGLVLDTPTWRAGTVWGAVMGLDTAQIRDINRASVEFCAAFRRDREDEKLAILLNGVIGASGDGYAIDHFLTGDEAFDRHRVQAEALAEAGADLVTAVTMTHSGEAIGAARAAQAASVPVAVSFTVETDGKLPSGETLAEAIAATDAATGAAPVYYMVNCAHPTHFSGVLQGEWVVRIGGIRANASRMSHAELDVATELDDGDPEEFGRLYRDLGVLLPNLRVIGGCCGSDHRHVGEASRHFHMHHTA
ncbi:MAG: homocysteine S-methyltransferase [Rhodobacter sp.]|nr:homocysteine S-methyltransferase [Rhodobacter sp.]